VFRLCEPLPMDRARVRTCVGGRGAVPAPELLSEPFGTKGGALLHGEDIPVVRAQHSGLAHRSDNCRAWRTADSSIAAAWRAATTALRHAC